jgi:hypothetical protein
MRIFALSTFVLPGGGTSEQGEVYDLPDSLAGEAIGMGIAAPFVSEPAPAEPPKPKTKKGSADVQP